MSKWLIPFLFSIITSNCLFAQQTYLEIKGKGSSLFLEHKVVPKESFYSIGRLYNVPPQELASYNNLQFGSGLSIGQELKIPLKEGNFTQTGDKTNEEDLVPVYHTIEPHETLYRIGVNYNKVSLPLLKKWNHHTTDAVSVGSRMIVGYLKVEKGNSRLDQNTVARNEANAVTGKIQKQDEKKTEVMVEPTPVVKETEPVKLEKSEKVAPPAIEEHKDVVPVVNIKSTINFSGGYFKKLFDQQTQNKSPVNNSGSAGIFKSTSGWQDGKYYCFNNDAAPGTILKVTSNSTGKSIYAKVLDAIPDIKQNEGLTVVISNAAAEELGIAENKFDCVLSYAK